MNHLYELINPSDMTTFKAETDKIACYCAVILGNGQYGCERYSQAGDVENIPALLILDPDPISTVEKYLECSLSDFAEQNKNSIKKCFDSFSYCSLEKRLIYDEALEAITDVDKLKQFKNKYEDRNRSSMNQIVNRAWQLAGSAYWAKKEEKNDTT